jgi:hypothetical protein
MWSIVCFAKFILTVIYQSIVVYNWPIKLPQKSMDEILYYFVALRAVKCHSYATKWLLQQLRIKGYLWKKGKVNHKMWVNK